MKLLSKKLWKWQNRNGCPRERERQIVHQRDTKEKEKEWWDYQTKFNAKRPKKDKKIFLFSFPDGKIYFLLIHFFHLPPSSHLANQKDFYCSNIILSILKDNTLLGYWSSFFANCLKDFIPVDVLKLSNRFQSLLIQNLAGFNDYVVSKMKRIGNLERVKE